MSNLPSWLLNKKYVRQEKTAEEYVQQVINKYEDKEQEKKSEESTNKAMEETEVRTSNQ